MKMRLSILWIKWKQKFKLNVPALVTDRARLYATMGWLVPTGGGCLRLVTLQPFSFSFD